MVLERVLGFLKEGKGATRFQGSFRKSVFEDVVFQVFTSYILRDEESRFRLSDSF